MVATEVEEVDRLPTLTITVSHMEDRKDRRNASAKYALLTIPTLGAVGTHLEQPVNVTISLESPRGESYTRDFPHLVHLYGGKHHPPAECKRIQNFNVHGEVAEDALINFLSEYRQSSAQP